MTLPAAAKFGKTAVSGTGAYWTNELALQRRLPGIGQQINNLETEIADLLSSINTNLHTSATYDSYHPENTSDEFVAAMTKAKQDENSVMDKLWEIKNLLMIEKADIIDDICSLTKSVGTNGDENIQTLNSSITNDLNNNIGSGLNTYLDPRNDPAALKMQLGLIYDKEVEILKKLTGYSNYQDNLNELLTNIISVIDDTCSFAESCVISSNEGVLTKAIEPTIRCAGLSIRPVFSLPR